MSYYTNLGRAKSLYDYKKRTDPAFVDFLDRCRLSSFSHRLEVWDFLDAPRSLLMKYPLLIGEIMNRTSADHPDLYYLKAARESVQEFVEEVDHKAGEAECDEIKKRLYFCCNDDNKMCQAVVDSRLLIYYGTVKNTKGSKLTLYLLDKSLVVARPATRNDTLVFQVSKEPIPVNQLLVEDVNDGEVRQGGSIRNTLNRTQAKHVFRVIRHHDDDVWESQTLLANSEHDKKAWLAALKSVMLKSQPHSVV
ncbi:rho guanine nucleotide exchange factor 3-like [Corticium candelabrum]|uniref:rho guanine nucleotide exchange factor 3-like n=1 Tax=Corticium candelabrum TaxID=121492 RepID=UPI002E257BE6|nr:rho guanine nucleotide exchange factor 3-like [Corticium candelabrum]